MTVYSSISKLIYLEPRAQNELDPFAGEVSGPESETYLRFFRKLPVISLTF